jgi:hypothetical protein
VSFADMQVLFKLSSINKTFERAVFLKSAYWKSLHLANAPSSFEPIFRRLVTTSLSQLAQTTITVIKFDSSNCVNDSTVIFILDHFPLLKSLDLTATPNVKMENICYELYAWKGMNNSLATGSIREIMFDVGGEYAGPKLALEYLYLDRCGRDRFAGNQEEFEAYWCSKSTAHTLNILGMCLHDITTCCLVQPAVCNGCFDVTIEGFPVAFCVDCRDVIWIKCAGCREASYYDCVLCGVVAHVGCSEGWENLTGGYKVPKM